MNPSPDSLRPLLSSLSTSQSSAGIARIWRARATAANFPAYLAHVTQHVFPALQAIASYRGGCVLQESETEIPSAPAPMEIQVITFWESMEAISSFAGEDCNRAVIEPAARAVLAGFDETVRHFAVRATSSGKPDQREPASEAHDQINHAH